MADKNHLKNPATNALFEAILSLNDMDECYSFFEDLCTCLLYTSPSPRDS